jgi:ADP-ribose pyrophosphatase YjhB (NUDIX family)
MDETDNNDIIVIPNYNVENNIDTIRTELKKNIWKKKENLYCNNCGKQGHVYKKCYEPILSYGIICLNLNDINIEDFSVSKYKFPNNIQQLKNICIIKYIQKNISCNNKKDLDIYEEKISTNIQTLMVRRKQTYNYIYIIRGLYNIDLESIIKSINLLTKIEYENLLTKDFDELWTDIFNSNNNTNNNEYNIAKEHFSFFKTYILPQIKHRIDIKYDYPEWGFPKGKRNNNETNLECAKREFEEETGLNDNNYTLLDRLFPLVENVKGSDDINYKHIYYIAILNNSFDRSNIKLNNINNNYEIGDINLYSIEKSFTVLREYNLERKELLNNLKLFLIYNIRYLEKFYHEKKLNL